MKLKTRTNKVWVVYGYDPTRCLWDEIDYSIHYRKLRYIFRQNYKTKAHIAHGYTKFILVRRNIGSLWEYNKNSVYGKFFTPCRVRDLLKRLAKHERTITHPDR